MRHNPNSKFIGATKAAEILGVSPQAVRDMIRDKNAPKLLGSFKAGSFWVIPRAEVMELKKEREGGQK